MTLALAMTATTTAVVATPAYAAAPTLTSVTANTGYTVGGETVSVVGTGLTGAISVTFGGVAGTNLTPDTATHLTVKAPAHVAGAVPVVVTHADGPSTETINYTYTMAPVPTATMVNPPAGPLAGGQNVTITGTNLTGATGVTFDGMAGTAVTVVSATSLTVTTPAGTAPDAAVIVTTPSGPSVTPLEYAYTALPTVDSLDMMAGPVGGTQVVTITGTNLTGATGVMFGNAAGTSLTGNTATALTVTTPAHAAGDVPVVVTTAGGDSDGTMMYTYAAAPTATLANPATDTSLGGTEITITGTNLTGATGVMFGAEPGTGLMVTNATSLKVTTPAHAAGAGNIVVTTPGGASTALPFTFTVPPNTAPSVTTQPLAQSKHVGATVTFTAAGSGWPTPTIQWQSMAAGGSWTDISGETTGTLTFAAAMMDNGKQYRAVFHNSSGADAMSGPATLAVLPDPPDAPAAPTVVAGTSKITATWTAPATHGSPITGYMVTANPGPATCTTTTALTCVLGASAGQAYTVTVVAKSAAGDSVASSASSTVTPTAPVIPTTPPATSEPLLTDNGPVNAAEPGSQLTLEGSGYAPYATVVVTIYSAPQQLASVTADASGNFSATVTLPGNLAAASHSLVASGIDANGMDKVQRMDVYVAAGATVRMRGPIVRNGAGLAQMFARGGDNNLYTSVQAGNGTWGAWTNLSGLIFSDPTAVLNNNGRLQVFAIGGDHSVWSRTQNMDGTFAWWARLGAEKWLHSFVLAQNQDGTVQVFGRGTDNNLYSQVQTDAADPSLWSGWINLSGLIFSEPTAFTRDDGIMEVFVVGGDGQVWHRVQSAPNSSTWAWWTHVTP